MNDTRRLLGTLQAKMAGRVDSTLAMLQNAAREAGYWITADLRIGEADLAALLGMTHGGLANKRREGTAPPSYTLGGGGHRVTYRLPEVAEWIESHREIA